MATSAQHATSAAASASGARDIGCEMPDDISLNAKTSARLRRFLSGRFA